MGLDVPLRVSAEHIELVGRDAAVQVRAPGEDEAQADKQGPAFYWKALHGTHIFGLERTQALPHERFGIAPCTIEFSALADEPSLESKQHRRHGDRMRKDEFDALRGALVTVPARVIQAVKEVLGSKLAHISTEDGRDSVREA